MTQKRYVRIESNLIIFITISFFLTALCRVIIMKWLELLLTMLALTSCIRSVTLLTYFTLTTKQQTSD